MLPGLFLVCRAQNATCVAISTDYGKSVDIYFCNGILRIREEVKHETKNSN